MDLRSALNAVSDVIANRPPPLREFDQIYMKAADMLLQADHISRWFVDKEVVFIGDGDALALSLVHLCLLDEIKQKPKRVHVLDFDERVVNSINRFAERHEYSEVIGASLYNVADALPSQHAGTYDGFYTNPPFGASNGGRSVDAFLRRGSEASKSEAVCCAALADYEALAWCDDVLRSAQRFLLERGFVVAEMVPKFHRYHLDDEPDLTSCSLVGRRREAMGPQKNSEPLLPAERADFYGRETPLTVRYVRDSRNGGKLVSRDYELESFV